MFKRLFCLCLLLASLGAEAAVDAGRLVDSARAQIGVTLSYDPVYRRIAYPVETYRWPPGCAPMGDPRIARAGPGPAESGARGHAQSFFRLPAQLGPEAPRPEHRPSPRAQPDDLVQAPGHGADPSDQAASYRPGDIVTWDLGRGLQHIGILSDRTGADGAPLALHNIGRGTQEEDILFRYRIIGHYRFAER